MKKMIIIILIMAITIPALAIADLPDISGLTLDELKQLDNNIHDTLFKELLPSGILVPAGEYIVGVDIPSGDYRADTVSDVGGIVTIYPSKQDKEKRTLSYRQEILLGKMWGTLVFRLTLNEGEYLVVNSNSLKLYPYQGLMDMSTPKE